MNTVKVKAKTGIYVGRITPENTFEFLGIRYCEPPKRWKAAEKLKESEEIIDALEYAPIISQFADPKEFSSGQGIPEMAEDALTLNIYTADLNKKKPVYVFIHGGSFFTGCAHIACNDGIYCGDRFVVNHPDIVYVNLTYRVGPLGSMNLEKLDPAGEYKDSINLNILDQERALEWIYENIESFGGDRERITVGGQSAGSYSVFVQLMRPECRKYFKAAILESSAPTDAEMKTLEISRRAADKFMEISGADTLEKLLALSSADLIKYGERLFYEGPRGAFGPTRDGRIVPLYPEKALEEAGGSGVILLSGTNEGEYDTMFIGKDCAFIREMIKRRNPQTDDGAIDEFIINYPDRDERTALLDMFNDAGMRIRQLLCSEAYVRGGGKVYQYYITYKPEDNYLRCQHVTELAAVSGKPDAKVTLGNSEEEQWIMGKRHDMEFLSMINCIWSGFIKTGSPDFEIDADSFGNKWLPYDLKNRFTMIIGNGGKMQLTAEPRERDLEIIRRLL